MVAFEPKENKRTKGGVGWKESRGVKESFTVNNGGVELSAVGVVARWRGGGGRGRMRVE